MISMNKEVPLAFPERIKDMHDFNFHMIEPQVIQRLSTNGAFLTFKNRFNW